MKENQIVILDVVKPVLVFVLPLVLICVKDVEKLHKVEQVQVLEPSMENLLAHLVEVLAPKAVAQDALDVSVDVELLVRALALALVMADLVGESKLLQQHVLKTSAQELVMKVGLRDATGTVPVLVMALVLIPAAGLLVRGIVQVLVRGAVLLMKLLLVIVLAYVQELVIVIAMEAVIQNVQGVILIVKEPVKIIVLSHVLSFALLLLNNKKERIILNDNFKRFTNTK